jgi:hypothetical protein
MTEEKKEVKEAEPIVQAKTEAPKAEAPAVETEQDKNWKKFREIREQERKAAEEAAKRAAEKEAEAAALKAALEAVVNKPQQQQFRHEEDQEESEEARFERKYRELRAREKDEEEKTRQEQDRVSMPMKLRQIHSDFDQVCSAQNLDYLDFHHPELARSLGARNESLEKWTDIYNAVKRYIPNVNSVREQARAEANLAKPQSFAGSTTPTGESMPATRLDESRKRANWERMQKALKGLS